ncbi:MAG: hypothetical protein R3E89_06995 [Thiolinea sp.]
MNPVALSGVRSHVNSQNENNKMAMTNEQWAADHLDAVAESQKTHRTAAQLIQLHDTENRTAAQERNMPHWL